MIKTLISHLRPVALSQSIIKGFILLVFGMLAKWLAGQMTVDQLQWLVRPMGWLINVYGDHNFSWYPGIGMLSEQLSIVINRGCVGTNFLIISWLVLIWNRLHERRLRHYLVMIPTTFVIAALTTILVNTFRVIGLMMLEPYLAKYFGIEHGGSVHLFYGSCLYIMALIGLHRISSRNAHFKNTKA